VKPLLFAIAATTIATTGRAQALQTTFTFDAADGGQISILKSLDGINMTIGSFSDQGPLSYIDIPVGNSFPLLIGPTYANFGILPYNSFAITFDQPVKLISYDLINLWLINGISTTFAQNSLQSIETYTTGLGSKSFNNQFVALANVPVSVASTNIGHPDRWAAINSLTVEKQNLPASVPGPLPILGFGAAFGLSRRLRRRVDLSK
jgi:hypothetical protein